MVRIDVRRRIARITALFLALGWGMAWATTTIVVTAHPDLLGLPWAQIVVGILISAWGGATATLGRYVAATYDGNPFHWKGEVVRDSAVSVSVGLGSYLAGWSWQLSPPMMGLTLILAGYGGTRVLSAALERALSNLTERRDRS